MLIRRWCWVVAYAWELNFIVLDCLSILVLSLRCYKLTGIWASVTSCMWGWSFLYPRYLFFVHFSHFHHVVWLFFMLWYKLIVIQFDSILFHDFIDHTTLFHWFYINLMLFWCSSPYITFTSLCLFIFDPFILSLTFSLSYTTQSCFYEFTRYNSFWLISLANGVQIVSNFRGLFKVSWGIQIFKPNSSIKRNLK